MSEPHPAGSALRATGPGAAQPGGLGTLPSTTSVSGGLHRSPPAQPRDCSSCRRSPAAARRTRPRSGLDLEAELPCTEADGGLHLVHDVPHADHTGPYHDRSPGDAGTLEDPPRMSTGCTASLPCAGHGSRPSRAGVAGSAGMSQPVRWRAGPVPGAGPPDRPPEVMHVRVAGRAEHAQVPDVGRPAVGPPAHMMDLTPPRGRPAPDAAPIAGDHREPLASCGVPTGPSYVEGVAVGADDHGGDVGIAADLPCGLR